MVCKVLYGVHKVLYGFQATVYQFTETLEFTEAKELPEFTEKPAAYCVYLVADSRYGQFWFTEDLIGLRSLRSLRKPFRFCGNHSKPR